MIRIVKHEQDTAQKDIEISIVYPSEEAKAAEHIESCIMRLDKTLGKIILCYSKDNSEKKINAMEVYYIESDKKTKTAYLVCENGRYRTKYRLWQLYEELNGTGFVYVSKHCILNLEKLEEIVPLFNSCGKAIFFENKITPVMITRKYIADVRREAEKIFGNE